MEEVESVKQCFGLISKETGKKSKNSEIFELPGLKMQRTLHRKSCSSWYFFLIFTIFTKQLKY